MSSGKWRHERMKALKQGSRPDTSEGGATPLYFSANFDSEGQELSKLKQNNSSTTTTINNKAGTTLQSIGSHQLDPI
jgi:hypothetical protein